MAQSDKLLSCNWQSLADQWTFVQRFCSIGSVPVARLAPPSEEEGLRAAIRLISKLGVTNDIELPERLAAALGWSVRSKDLGAKSGGHQALLVPLLDGGFSILVDPWSPDAPDSSAGIRCRQFRIADELAHSILRARQSANASLGLCPPRRGVL